MYNAFIHLHHLFRHTVVFEPADILLTAGDDVGAVGAAEHCEDGFGKGMRIIGRDIETVGTSRLL